MLDENKDKLPKVSRLPNDLLMKPFELGWTREVVKRVITKNGTPNCDIYYFSPSGKKIRSLTEIRSNLTDGLTPECFSFRREPLGLNTNYETVRNARVRGKTDEKVQKSKPPKSPKKVKNENCEEEKEEEKEFKKEAGGEDEYDGAMPKDEVENRGEKSDVVEEAKGEDEVSENAKSDGKEADESKSFNNKKKTKTKAVVKEKPRIRPRSIRARKEALKKILRAKQVKQAKVVASKKILKKIVKKTVAKPPKSKLVKAKTQKETVLKNKLAKKKGLITSKAPAKVIKPSQQVKNKVETLKNEAVTSENDKKAIARDLKSIVQKNIGKYREMREKQKLGAVKNLAMKPKKIALTNITRVRSEPISKNIKIYLKPLEKGWRRELVFRMNSARAGQQADVYYFHPSGRKLRSCREISENLTPGLTIECFTFRKEPLGCGEPCEVIRNARSPNKPLQTNKRKEASDKA